MLSAVLIASLIQLVVQFQAAAYSDRHGRRGVYLAGATLLGLWSFVLFPLIDTGNFFLIVVGISGGLSFMAMQYGPQAAFYTELFSTQVRYSGGVTRLSNWRNIRLGFCTHYSCLALEGVWDSVRFNLHCDRGSDNYWLRAHAHGNKRQGHPHLRVSNTTSSH